MKKLTIRLDELIYNKLYYIANDNATSVNKIVSFILEKYINNPRNEDYLKEINLNLNLINEMLDKISKRQCKHFLVSKQHFANFGYLSNADINEDKCLNDLLNKKDNFND